MAIGLEVIASNFVSVLTTLAPIIALILVLLGGIMYGVAQTQPPDTRGKWQSAALSMLVGGAIVAAITMAAGSIVDVAGTALTST